MCGSGPRITCVVDGDTVWFDGVKYRFEEIDTPEKGGLAECMQEGLQAIKATKRLAEILSSREFTIETSGKDRYGRVLAQFVIGSTTAGRMLVDEAWRDPGAGGPRIGASRTDSAPTIHVVVAFKQTENGSKPNLRDHLTRQPLRKPLRAFLRSHMPV